MIVWANVGYCLCMYALLGLGILVVTVNVNCCRLYASAEVTNLESLVQ